MAGTLHPGRRSHAAHATPTADPARSEPGTVDRPPIDELCRQLADERTRRQAQAALRKRNVDTEWGELLRFAAHLARHTEPEVRRLDADTRQAHAATIAAFLAPSGDPCDDARKRALHAGLADPDAGVRALAAELVGQRGEPGALEAL